jgi:hypothetical protein
MEAASHSSVKIEAFLNTERGKWRDVIGGLGL